MKSKRSQRKIVISAATCNAHTDASICIKCGDSVEPGRCYRGRCLSTFTHITREKSVHDAAGNHGIERYQVPIAQYDRGYICDDCAGEYRSARRVHRNGSVTEHPIVITDPLPGLTVRDEREGARSYKGFNTRVTR